MSEQEFTDQEVADRRDAILRVMVNTPPQPRTNNRPVRKSQKQTGAGQARKASDRPQKP